MTSLVLNIEHSDAFSESLSLNRSVKKSKLSHCKVSRLQPWVHRSRKKHGLLLRQLDICYDQLSKVIMTELEDRERINKELREQVHTKLQDARNAIDNFKGNATQQERFYAQLTKFEGLVSDPNRRLKSDTLRKLIETVDILINKTGGKVETQDAVPTTKSEPAVSTTVTITSQPPQVETKVDSVVIQDSAPSTPVLPTPEILSTEADRTNKAAAPDSTEIGKIVSQIQTLGKITEPLENQDVVKSIEIRKEVPEQQVLIREIISEEAKLRQREQIPWRVPKRLEPVVEGHPNTQHSLGGKVGIAPLPVNNLTRLAMKYKIKKRPPARSHDCNEQFKKPFMPDDSRPLFQRRHQLPSPPMGNPVAQTFTNRDPRSFANYCHRQTMLMQNRTRFENQNQQYYKNPPTNRPPQNASLICQTEFRVPAAPVAKNARCSNPKSSASATVTKSKSKSELPRVEQAIPAPAVRVECRKAINPVYRNDEPIRLGKKDLSKKGNHSNVSGHPNDDSAQKPSEKAKVESEKIQRIQTQRPNTPTNDPKNNNTQKSDIAEKSKKKNNAGGSKASQVDKGNLMNLLKEIGDENKVKKILDVMNKNSDDESCSKSETTVADKKKKKYKRIRTKTDGSSSEDEASKQKKGKSKQNKPAVSRELINLIENSSDFMAKGGELNNSRRRTQSSPAEKQAGYNDSESDEDIPSSSKKQKQDESLLTVAKSPPAKKKPKSKEGAFVYNDKRTVHFNSSFGSNCALCSFNGSAIVDHYVYEHKQYEVFVSRVSPRIAEIIHNEPFLTNGLLLNEGDMIEKIRFKCYFCLLTKELNRSEWIQHMTSHTGEYRYRCTSCPVMSQSEELSSAFLHDKSCLKPSLALYNEIEFQDNHVYGFICNACNYIQVRRVNMERHLKREHPSADVTCTRFSMINYKIETKMLIDEDQALKELIAPNIPTVVIPLQPKNEPVDSCEIINQPFTEDEEMNEETTDGTLAFGSHRTDIRLNSVHLGSASAYNPLEHRPFCFKEEQELQGDQITSSGHCEESPMSPEPSHENSEAEAVVPVIQIQSIQGGFDFGSVFVKRESDEAGYDSDASDKTTDFNMSDGVEEGRQVGENSTEKQSGTGDNSKDTSGSGQQNSSAGAGEQSSSTSGNATGSAAGSGGDDGDKNGKKEEFPVPFTVKKEKEDENNEKQPEGENPNETAAAVVIKTEKPDSPTDTQTTPEEEYDFVELVLDSTRIEHVAFIEKPAGILYLCLMPGCKYLTKVQQEITNHIQRRHSQVIWDGYCHPCQSQIVIMDNCTITNELQHMMEVHARRKTPTLEVTSARSTTPSVLRIRRMPGDTLSSADPNPPPLTPIQLPLVTPIMCPQVNMGQPPLIIQSSATITAMPMNSAPIIAPTHTIPAQIRPVLPNPQPPMIATNSVPTPPATTGVPKLPTMANLRLNTVRLKPWTNMVTTKNQEHCRSMLEEISLHCLYKCMARQCAFTTSNRFFMEQHLQLHEEHHVGGPNSPRKCWLECAYCDLIAPNTAALLVHIDVEHASCGFQCNLCFYRSRDPTNVVVHQKTYHPSAHVPKKILIIPDNLKSFGDDEWKSMQESLRKNVLPLHCTSEYDFSEFNLGGHS